MEYKYIIWHDNDFDLAYWVRANTILKNERVQLRCIPKTNQPSQITNYFKDECTKTVMQYIKYETPDIIIQELDKKAGYPVLCVTELMTHTPQWQHPAQRFTRLYTSSILKTPTALIIPQHKTKWEKGTKTDYRSTSYSCSPSVYQLFVDSTTKNNTPTLIFNWPDNNGYLLYDEYHQTSPFPKDDIKKWFKFVDACISKKGHLDTSDYSDILSEMKKKAEMKQPTDFDTISGVFDTQKIIKLYNLDRSKLSARFLSNAKTLVFSPNGLKCSNSKFRTDPYAGMLCAFDIMFCRNHQFERKINLLLVAKNVKNTEINFTSEKHNSDNCPFIDTNKPLDEKHLKTCCFTQPKHRRIYGEVSDVVVFDDNIFYNGDTK